MQDKFILNTSTMVNNLLGYDLTKITSHKSTMCHIEQKNGRLPSKITLLLYGRRSL